jgi:hypothetical protein
MFLLRSDDAAHCSLGLQIVTARHHHAVADGCAYGQAVALLNAYTVLENAIRGFHRVGALKGRATFGRLMESSRDVLPWLDYDLVRDGLRLRNQVAHRLTVPSPDEVREVLTAITTQLSAWGVGGDRKGEIKSSIGDLKRDEAAELATVEGGAS